MTSLSKIKGSTAILITVAALGYFVDIYDLVLFNIVKKASLEQILIGHSAEIIKNTGIFLFNMQMLGMLIGGILWGVWGDKRGRVSVLFGSILLYSAANIANAFVTDVNTYAMLRFLAGIGLAGELGAGVTLVSEAMSKEKRGYGTMIIVTFGALGAVLAAFVGARGTALGEILLATTGIAFANWQVAYLVGGTLGLMLLALRLSIYESGMFQSLQHTGVSRGNFFKLFNNRERFFKYLNCILIGLPIWYMIGVLISLSQDVFSIELKVDGVVENGTAIMCAYIGLSVGDLLSGLLSQWFRSRKKIVLAYLTATVILVLAYLFMPPHSSLTYFYTLCFLLGCATGYWALFVVIASEQFGTNIRSTVTNTVPNFVRGAVLPITVLFTYLTPFTGSITSALIVGMICIGLAFIATLNSKETFGKDLNYTEIM
ncbi:MAG: MFS transporter [Gammaproteobacteria bacterium]|nr:MFS transporter [Gammaproteobacteria bacterium]